VKSPISASPVTYTMMLYYFGCTQMQASALLDSELCSSGTRSCCLRSALWCWFQGMDVWCYVLENKWDTHCSSFWIFKC